MAIFTRQSLRLGPAVVPTQPVEIDRDNALIDELSGYYIPGLNLRDFSDFGGNLTSKSGTISTRATPVGPALYFNGTAAYIASQKDVYPYTSGSPPTLNNLTLSALLFLPTAPSDLTQFLTLGTHSDGNHPTGLLKYGSLGYGGNNWQIRSGAAPPVGEVFLFTGVTDLSAGTLTQYVNGNIVYGPTTVSAASNLNGPAALNPSYWNHYSEVAYIAAAIWKRSLTSNEVQEFAAEPFAMLRPIVRRQYYVAASAAATPSILLVGAFGSLGVGVDVATTNPATAQAAFGPASASIGLLGSNPLTAEGAFGSTGATVALAGANPTAVAGAFGLLGSSVALLEADQLALSAGLGPLGASVGLAQAGTDALVLSGAFGSLGSSVALLDRDQLSLAGAFGPLGSGVVLGQAGSDAISVVGAFGSLGAGLALGSEVSLALAGQMGPLRANIALLERDQLALVGAFGSLGAAIGLGSAVPDHLSLVGAFGGLGAGVGLLQLLPAQPAPAPGAAGPTIAPPATSGALALPPPAAPISNPKTGAVTPTWRQYLLQLGNYTGKATTTAASASAAATAANNPQAGSALEAYIKKLVADAGLGGVGVWDQAGVPGGPSDVGGATAYYNVRLHTLFEWNGSRWVSNLVANATAGLLEPGQLNIPDPSNLVTNPNWSSGGRARYPSTSGWSAPGGGIPAIEAVSVAGTPAVPSGAVSYNVGRMTGAAAEFGSVFAVVPGETYFFSMWVASASAGLTPSWGLELYNSDESLSGFAAGASGSLTAGSWQLLAGQVTVPADVPGTTSGVAYALLWLESGIGASLAGPLWLGPMIARKAASAELLVPASITSAYLVDGAVTSAKVASLAASKISGLLNTANIPTLNDLAAANGALSGSNLVPLSITAAQVSDATLTGAKLAANAGIAAGQIASVAASAISGTLGASQVPSLDQLSGLLNLTQVAGTSGGVLVPTQVPPVGQLSGTLAVGQLAANSITGDKIAAGTLVANNIASGTITGTLIAAGAIATVNLAAGAVDASKIAANSITASQIAAGTITGTLVAAGTLTGNNVQAGSLTATQIAAGTISGDRIAANTISTNNLAAGSVGTAQLIAGSVFASKLTLTDLSNICGNPDFATSGADGTAPDNWTTPDTGGTVVSLLASDSGVPSGAVGQTVAQVTVRNAFYGSSFAVVPGESYYLSVQIAGDPTNGAGVGLFYSDSTGTRLGAAFAASATPSSTWQILSGQLTIPATSNGTAVAEAQLWLEVAGADNVALPAVYFTRVTLRKAASAELLVDGSITASKIASQTITAGQIAGGTITASQIASGTITANQLYSGTVQGYLIQGTNVAANTLTVNNLAAGTLSASNITAGTIDAAIVKFTDAFVTNAYIQNLAVGSSKIASGGVQGGNILGGAVSSSSYGTAQAFSMSLGISTNAYVYIFVYPTIVLGSQTTFTGYTIKRNGTQIFGGSNAVKDFGMAFVDNPGAGSYTYEFDVAGSGFPELQMMLLAIQK